MQLQTTLDVVGMTQLRSAGCAAVVHLLPAISVQSAVKYGSVAVEASLATKKLDIFLISSVHVRIAVYAYKCTCRLTQSHAVVADGNLPCGTAVSVSYLEVSL